MNPLDGLEFAFTWRAYQTRVLGAIDLHLADQKLHIVAAPGAGKTTLGLEVFRRLGRRCLVLSPTRVIRDQWIARLQDFVDENSWPTAWTSTDLDTPGFLTSITYQALHVRYRQTIQDDEPEDDYTPDSGEVDALITHIRDARIGTLILDEAHHLRDEWWKALTRVVERVADLQLIALTATPPYDVTNHEWAKYQALCGPIDEEISIPELVQAGTLCPHQDFVWFVALTDGKREQLRAYDIAVANLCDELFESDDFQSVIETHPWLGAAESPTSELLDHPELAFGLLIFLNALGRSLPLKVLALLEVDTPELPTLDRRWWQVLVNAFLFHPSFGLTPAQEDFRASLAKRLRARELLVRRELRLNESKPIKRMLALANKKVSGCIDIHRLERQVRGESLRQVILTDFIRDEEGTEKLHRRRTATTVITVRRQLLSRSGQKATYGIQQRGDAKAIGCAAGYRQTLAGGNHRRTRASHRTRGTDRADRKLQVVLFCKDDALLAGGGPRPVRNRRELRGSGNRRGADGRLPGGADNTGAGRADRLPRGFTKNRQGVFVLVATPARRREHQADRPGLA